MNRRALLLQMAHHMGYLSKEQYVQMQDSPSGNWSQLFSHQQLQNLRFLFFKHCLLQYVVGAGHLSQQTYQQLMKDKISALRLGRGSHTLASIESQMVSPDVYRQAAATLRERNIINEREMQQVLQLLSGHTPASHSTHIREDETAVEATDFPPPRRTETKAELLLKNLEKPTQLGRFALLKKLGMGGMGVVYQGRDPNTGKVIAIKVMLSDPNTAPRQQHRFFTEARLTEKLQHDNIVKVYGIEKIAEMPCIIMEFIDGEPLHKLIHDNRITAHEALQIARDISLAIGYAHRQSVIHRDLKPQNVMIENGTRRVIVMDFGLAKDIDISSGMTKTGDIIGTPRYMAPEQVSGNKREISPRTDIYALGAILYELVTGIPAVDGDSPVNLMYNVLEKELVPPSERNPQLGKDIDYICHKAMAKNPQQRYASAEELARDLRRAIHGKPVVTAYQSPLLAFLLQHKAIAVPLISLFIVAVVYMLWPAAEISKQREVSAQTPSIQENPTRPVQQRENLTGEQFRPVALTEKIESDPPEKKISLERQLREHNIRKFAHSEALAKNFLTSLAKKDLSHALALTSAPFRQTVSKEQLQKGWQDGTINAGHFQRFLETKAKRWGSYDSVFVRCDFSEYPVDFQIDVNAYKQVTGFWFFTAEQQFITYQPPQYVRAGTFYEEEITVGQGGWSVPGTLSLPTTAKNFPAVVLVHDSYYFADRDGCNGPNRHFLDLAWGLASQGIAVLRYDKKTFHYVANFGANPETFSIDREIVDDAVAAVQLLNTIKEIDQKRIFVLGHGLGGMMTPKIARRQRTIAGFIILAAYTRPIEDIFFAENRYMLAFDGITEQENTQLQQFYQMIEKVKKLDPKTYVPPQMLPFGYPQKYWLALRGYKPTREIAGTNKPLLILQGERDHRTSSEEFRDWQMAVATREDATCKMYPQIDHFFFFIGDRQVSPQEYQQPHNVDRAVVDDIAAWIHKH